MRQRFLLLLIPLFFVGCSKNDEKVAPNVPIQFGASVTTILKSATLVDAFKDGDKIGIFGERVNNGAKTSFMQDVEFSYQSGKFTSSSELAFWEIGTSHNFYAYYPKGNDVQVSGTADSPVAKISIGAEGAPVDLMWGKSENVAYTNTSSNPVLAFTHKLSMVKFVIKKASSNIPKTAISAIKFTVDRNAGNLNLLSGALTPEIGDKELIKSLTSTNLTTDDTYNAEAWSPIVLPGSTVKSMSITLNGVEIPVYFQTPGPSFAENKITSIVLTITGSGITLTSSITPWGSGETFNGGIVRNFTYNVNPMGTLASKTLFGIDKDTITTMKIAGTLNAQDLSTLKNLLPKLEYLDLKDAKVDGDIIPDQAFSQKVSLKTIIFPSTLKGIGYRAFWNCTGLKGELNFPLGLTSIGEDAFVNCAGLTGSLTIPEGVTNIGVGAFFNCSGFDGNLNLPNSLTTINVSTFWGCFNLKGELKIPNSVTEIGELAFSKCKGFTGTLVLPSNLKSIDKNAFRECSGFSGDLIIPVAVKTIGEYAFADATGISSIKVAWTTPIPYTTEMLPTSKTLYVPLASASAYQNAEGWKNYYLVGY